MGAYLIRRLLLVIPTLWAIITINFFIVQIAPGGPVDQAIAAIEFGNAGVLPGAGGEGVRASHAQTGVGNISDSNYRGGRGLDPEVIAEITKRYGFDKPLYERYFTMLWNYARFDFGDSLFRSSSVLQLVKDSLSTQAEVDQAQAEVDSVEARIQAAQQQVGLLGVGRGAAFGDGDFLHPEADRVEELHRQVGGKR